MKKDDLYWFDQLDTDNYLKAIAYFRNSDTPPQLLINPPDDFPALSKSKWEATLLVLEKWIERDEIVLVFLGYLLDPNWPGFYFAWCTIVLQGSKIASIVDEEIVKAAEVNDTDTVEMFQELKADIDDYVSLDSTKRKSIEYLFLFDRCIPLAAKAVRLFLTNLSEVSVEWNSDNENWYRLIYELHRLRNEAGNTKNGTLDLQGDINLVNDCEQLLNKISDIGICSASNDPGFWYIMLSINYDLNFIRILQDAASWFIQHVDQCGWSATDYHWQLILDYLINRKKDYAENSKMIDMFTTLESAIDAWFEQEMKEHRYDVNYHFDGLFEIHTREIAMEYFQSLERPHPLVFELLCENIDACRASPFKKWQTGLLLLHKWCNEFPEYYMAMLERMYYPCTAFAWEVLVKMGLQIMPLVEKQTQYFLELLPDLENAEQTIREEQSELISAYNCSIYNPVIFKHYSKVYKVSNFIEKLQQLSVEIDFLYQPELQKNIHNSLELLPARSESAWSLVVSILLKKIDTIPWKRGDERWNELNESLNDGFQLAGSYLGGIHTPGGNEELLNRLVDLRKQIVLKTDDQE